MTPSLRPVAISIIRERLPLPFVTLAVTSFLHLKHRAAGGVIDDDLRTLFGLLVYLGLIPMLVVAMASSWLRGDGAPWAWALARPVSRARWLCTTVSIDLATVVACCACASITVGPPPRIGLGLAASLDLTLLAYAAVLWLIYAAAAFAGARGGSAIAGALHASGLMALVTAVTALGSAVEAFIAAALLGYDVSFFSAIQSAISLNHYDTFALEVTVLAPLLVMSAFVSVALLRVAARAPARPRFAQLLAPVGTAVLLAGVIVPVTVVSVIVSVVGHDRV